jgi:teichuronic acid biosynthesis glycosyltransferase TuaH
MPKNRNQRRVIYLSHVHPRWIKQRPQFLVEELSKSDSFTISYAFSVLTGRSKLTRSRVSRDVRLTRLLLAPQVARVRVPRIARIGDFLAVTFVWLALRPDILIVTHPKFLHFGRFSKRLGITLVYDCMDFNAKFENASDQTGLDEIALIEESRLVICSSNRILEDISLLSRRQKIKLLRNALDFSSFSGLDYKENADSAGPPTIGYFGTISSWFDWDPVISLALARPDVLIRIWGPLDVNIPHVPENIILYSAIPHDQAIEQMKKCSLLIMPFRVTPLIEGVDPVKIYEYIASGKPVLAAKYEELDHFGDFILRYRTTEEFVELANQALNAKGVPLKEVRDFIHSNSWANRAIVLEGLLNEL